ncbi:MAG: biotin-dependent carboxyltransferase family protein [Magnetovibrionaceae bacterium]
MTPDKPDLEKPELIFLDGGLQTTVQDRGRLGFQDIGLPVAGAMDREAMAVANALVGNDPGEAILEVRFQGPRFRVEGAPITLALVGPGATMTILTEEGEVLNGPAFESVRVLPGSEVSIPPLKTTATAVISIAGGLDLEPVMGSRSTFLRGGLGGYRGRALKAGDRLGLRGSGPVPLATIAEPQDWHSDEPIRVVLGPQDDAFTDAGIRAFLSTSYRISAQADRMGYRLEGEPLEHADGFDIVSDGIALGAIQVPGSGLPIILLADHQTAGGYPKIAHVASVDIPRLGRLMPGSELLFRAVSQQEAEELYRTSLRALRALIGSATLKSEGSALDLEALYSCNLISGVLDASGETI